MKGTIGGWKSERKGEFVLVSHKVGKRKKIFLGE